MTLWRPFRELNGTGGMRERILSAVVLMGLLLSALALVPGVLLALRQKTWGMPILGALVLGCGTMLLLARGLGYEKRAWAASVLIYTVGVEVLFLHGFLSGGPVWLFAFGVVLGLLLGVRAALIGVGINALTLAGLGWLHAATAVGQGHPFFATWPHGLAFFGSFLFLNTLAAVSCALLLEDEKQAAASLRREKTDLIETKRRLEEEILSRREAERRQEAILRELESSEERYRHLVNQAPAGIWEMDLQTGRIVNVNAIMCTYLGYGREEFLTLSPLALFSDEGLTHFLERGRAIFSGKRVTESTEYEIRRKDGSTFWVRSHANILSKEGVPRKATWVFHDITEVKKLEKEKRGLEERLLEARKMEAIATLAGGVAHQVNNALSVVSGGLDLLEVNMGEPERRERYLWMIRESTKGMAALTRQLLAYAGGGKYDTKVLPLCRFVAESLPPLLTKAPASVRVETSLQEDAPSVKMDPNQMTFLLSALLTNALEAMEGQGTLRIFCNSERVLEGGPEEHPDLLPGLYAGLTLEDTGRGMDPETLRRVFDPFFTTKFQGRGLGMPAVLGIVKNHGGWIGLESRPEKGTTVHILLPALETEEEGVYEEGGHGGHQESEEPGGLPKAIST